MNLQNHLIRLGKTHKSLRPHIRPVLAHLDRQRKEGSTFDTPMFYIKRFLEGVSEDLSFARISAEKDPANRVIDVSPKGGLFQFNVWDTDVPAEDRNTREHLITYYFHIRKFTWEGGATADITWTLHRSHPLERVEQVGGGTVEAQAPETLAQIIVDHVKE